MSLPNKQADDLVRRGGIYASVLFSIAIVIGCTASYYISGY